MSNILPDIEKTFQELNVPQSEIDSTLEALDKALYRGYTLDEVLSFIDNGSYKECYEGPGNTVIKFASEENASELETCVVTAAKRAGLSNVFVPTYVFQLPQNLDLVHLDLVNTGLDEEGEEDYEYQQAEAVIIQPRVVTAENAKLYEDHYIPDTYPADAPVSFPDYQAAPYRSLSWIELFNAEVYKKFTTFCKQYGIYDLYSANVGVREGEEGEMYPVVFDFATR